MPGPGGRDKRGRRRSRRRSLRSTGRGAAPLAPLRHVLGGAVCTYPLVRFSRGCLGTPTGNLPRGPDAPQKAPARYSEHNGAVNGNNREYFPFSVRPLRVTLLQQIRTCGVLPQGMTHMSWLQNGALRRKQLPLKMAPSRTQRRCFARDWPAVPDFPQHYDARNARRSAGGGSPVPRGAWVSGRLRAA